MARSRATRPVLFYVQQVKYPRLDAWITNNPRTWQAVARDLLELALTEGIVPDSLGHHVSLTPPQGQPLPSAVAQEPVRTTPQDAPVATPAAPPQTVSPAPPAEVATSSAEDAPPPSGEDLAERLRRAHAKLKGAF